MIRNVLHRAASRRGFTLVELLVVISIIGILMTMMLPAISAIKESMRNAVCKNNLHQIGLAMRGHCDQYGYFPTGGTTPWPAVENYMSDGHPWGATRQGLGWGYQILPFMGLENAFYIRTQYELQKVSIGTYFCPSRRRPTVRQNPSSAPKFGESVLNDYAASTPAEWTDPTRYTFKRDNPNDISRGSSSSVPHNMTYKGVIVRTNADAMPGGSGNSVGSTSPVALASVQSGDGLTWTMMVGEKMVNSDTYYGGSDIYDDRGWSDGWSPNTIRSTGFAPLRDQTPDMLGGDLNRIGYAFGSAHTGGFNATFADSQVRTIKYNIDRSLFNALGDRSDGYLIDETAF